MDKFIDVVSYTKNTDDHYGTGGFAFYLYGLIKMIKPLSVIELGTGVGTTCFLSAQACKENNKGKVITIDNGQDYHLNNYNIDYDFNNHVDNFELSNFIELRKTNLNLANLEILNDIEQVDILFNDIDCSPHYVLTLLTWLLPRINTEGYLIVDRASTHWPTYCAIELVLTHLNQGKIPKIMLELIDNRQEFKDLIQNFKFSVQHVLKEVEHGDDQDSFAIIKIEENNIGYRMI